MNFSHGCGAGYTLDGFMSYSIEKRDLVNSQSFKLPKIDRESEIDYFGKLPSELILKIFSYLNGLQLGKCLLVNNTWLALSSTESLWKALFPKIAFGKKHWETYFGKIEEEPLLPKKIYKILESLCPFWTGKKVKETHMLVLIPKTIDGKPITLKTLEELAKAPKKGYTTKFRLLQEILNQYGNQSISESHWVLMTKDLVPESTGKLDNEYSVLLAEIAKTTGMNYEFPNLLDIITCICATYVRSRARLFDSWYFYAVCQEKIQNDRIGVGCAPSNDFIFTVIDNCFDSDFGIAPAQKFFQT